MDADTFTVSGLDHIVLCVQDVARTREFYEPVLGLESREERPGKWSLHFGPHKISLQDATTVPGSGNYCVLSDRPVADWLGHLRLEGAAMVDGPGEWAGATGPILSAHVMDPEGNLVEISNLLG